MNSNPSLPQTQKVSFTPKNPCPICRGHRDLPSGKRVRCHGYQSGDYANCSREEYAGGLQENPSSQTYGHRLIGDCKCGNRHDPRPASTPKIKASPRPKVFEAEYDYRDEDESYLFTSKKFRYIDEEGGKTFTQGRYATDGKWIPSIKDVRRVLYRLPELLAAPPSSNVYMPEGEKDVDRLRDLGLFATCNPMGANSFLPDYAIYLKGHHAVILEDNDDDGRRHVLGVAHFLHGYTASTKILDFRSMPEKSDVSDWLDAGNDIEALITEAKIATPWTPKPFAQVAAGVESLDESEVKLPFPNSAWRGLFGTYRDIVSHTTEASDVFHFWMFALVLGLTLGLRIAVQHAGRLFPNFYIVLVGTSGWARKDTAFNRAAILLDLLHTNDDRERPALQRVSGIGSIEGFLDKVQGSKAALLRLPEFASLLRKGKQEATSNILPMLTQIYDCPSVVENPTRSNQTIWKDPCLSIAAGSTKEWLHKSLTPDDIKGGFGNRFIYALGARKGPMAYPPEVDLGRMAELAKSINLIRSRVDNLEPAGRILHASEDTKDVFNKWYEPFYLQAIGEGIIASHAVRMQDFAWKLALLYAVCDNSFLILPEHLEAALAVVNWQREANRVIFADFSGSNRDLELRIIARLEVALGRTIIDRDMYKSLKIPSGRLSQIYKGMRDIGLVRQTQNDGKSSHSLIG